MKHEGRGFKSHQMAMNFNSLRINTNCTWNEKVMGAPLSTGEV